MKRWRIVERATDALVVEGRGAVSEAKKVAQDTADALATHMELYVDGVLRGVIRPQKGRKDGEASNDLRGHQPGGRKHQADPDQAA